MKISKIKIRSLFGINQQELDGKSVELIGKNGAGKSSVLDSIKYALTAKSDRKYVIKNGETEGEILIETDTGLSIDRKARTEQSPYKSVKQGEVPVNSPEAFLKTIFSPLQLDPIAFMEMSEKEQNAIILQMIQYDWDMDTIKGWFGEIVPDVNYDQSILGVLNDIQAENGHYYRKRQEINRDARAKKAIVDEIKANLPVDYNGDDWRNVSLSDTYAKLERIRKENAGIEKARLMVNSRDQKVRSFQADKEIALAALDREMSAKEKELDTELASLKERIASIEKEKAGLSGTKATKAESIENKFKADTAAFEAEVAGYADLATKEPTPVDELEKEATNAEKMKSFLNEWDRMGRIEADIDDLEEQSSVLTAKIEKARTLPGEILEQSEIPIEGLTVKDGVPLIHGLPISNLSSGEKLDLCIDVSLQNAEGLKLILLDGTERLSDDLREHAYSKCKAAGIQIIASRTTSDDELKVVEL